MTNSYMTAWGQWNLSLVIKQDSLERIFAIELQSDSTTICFHDTEVAVYVVASKGFQFDEFQEHLQCLVECKTSLQEPTYFELAIENKLGIEDEFSFQVSTNVWFDFVNDVLWTIDENNMSELVSVLEGIKRKWSKE